MTKHMCDYWLASRRKCRRSGTVLAEDAHGASFRFCWFHWPLAQLGIQFGPLTEVGRVKPTIAVVTKAPMDGGNMALGLGQVFMETRPAGEPPTYLPVVTPLGSQFLGQAIMNLRVPVFRPGEILLMSGDRDTLGRNPSKWGVEVQMCSGFEEAYKVAVKAVEERSDP